jgi:hypothetical protein
MKQFAGLIFICLALLVSSGGAQQGKKKKKTPQPPSLTACLPPDVKADEFVSFAMNGKGGVTVQAKLKEIKAVCRQGKLYAPDAREIRFFRPACWGNPPMDADEIRAQEARQLAELQKCCHVIIFQCDPMMH